MVTEDGYQSLNKWRKSQNKQAMEPDGAFNVVISEFCASSI
jgi:hypothetical protein